MVEINQNEEEQVEALKRWWEQNGRTAIMALVLVLVTVFGWQQWRQHERNQAEFASVAYEIMQSDPEQADERGRALLGSYPQSGYASLAAFSMARSALEAGRADEAANHLRWVMDKGANEALRLLARQRLARVLLDLGKTEEALSTINGAADEAGYAAAFAEVRGDILLSLGRGDEARAAYQAALDGYTEVPAKQSLLQMKIDDLATAEAR